MSKHYQSIILIHAPAERVWQVLCDVDHWQAWTASITRVERLSGISFVPGACFKILQPRLRPATWTITELEPGRRFTWESSQPGVRVVAQHVLKPLPDGCEVTLSITFTGPLGGLFGWLGRDLTMRYIDMESSGLKRQCERAAA